MILLRPAPYTSPVCPSVPTKFQVVLGFRVERGQPIVSICTKASDPSVPIVPAAEELGRAERDSDPELYLGYLRVARTKVPPAPIQKDTFKQRPK